MTDTPVSPVHSMTGYAAVRKRTESGELTLSLRTVNHRGLDLHFHHGSEMAPFENSLRTVLKRHIARGHVEIRSSFVGEDVSIGLNVDRPTLARYVAAFRETANELGLRAEPDLNVLLGLPGVVMRNEAARKFDESFEATVVAAICECVRELNESRRREGRALVTHIQDELVHLEAAIGKIAAIRARATEHFQNRLGERLRELLTGANIPESRLAEEAATLADRSDVQEEVTRLTVHAQELHRILDEGGEVGKRIDFLVQEMNRETNTILSKTSGIGEVGLTVTSLGLSIKSHIEKIREQALNLE